MPNIIEHNTERLKYLIDLYQLSVDEFLTTISVGLKKKIRRQDVLSGAIKLDYLKRIDKIFHKGLSFYLDPQPLPQTKEASIFFRKKEFNSPLNLGAKKIVNEYEDLKFSLSSIAKLSDIEIKRMLPILTIKQNAKTSSHQLRETLKPSFLNNQKDFLKSLINKLAVYNVLVFEFVETWNQKEKANIDGVFLNPNVIVLKRQDGTSFRREIFTLMHEFAHYLLNIEEIERLDYDVLANRKLSDVEEWCNEFAFYFLLGDYEKIFNNLPFANRTNDYNFETIETISTKTHLSKIALFTRLFFNKKISWQSYLRIKIDFEIRAKEHKEEIKRQRELDKERGGDQKGSSPKPIKSDLLISTIQTAFYEGIIDEYQVCKTLKITPDKISNYIQ